MLLHGACDPLAGELSAALTRGGLQWLYLVQAFHVDLNRPEGLIAFAFLIETLAPVSSLDG